MDMLIKTMEEPICIRQTCFGRILGLGPWYLTTPVQDATKKLHIISTKHLWKKRELSNLEFIDLINSKSLKLLSTKRNENRKSRIEVVFILCHDLSCIQSVNKIIVNMYLKNKEKINKLCPPWNCLKICCIDLLGWQLIRFKKSDSNEKSFN